MIVCLCHGVSERTLEKIIDEGAGSLKAIQKQCGAGGDCGSCRFHIAQMLHEAERPAERSSLVKEPLCALPLLRTG
jgi:bacterioferritin-associated ferredoxin